MPWLKNPQFFKNLKIESDFVGFHEYRKLSFVLFL